jgi:DNA-binding MarR family transcriptional regulator
MRKKRASNLNRASKVPVDLETRATKDDHEALRLWLRLLSCTTRVENHVSSRLRREFATTLPRFDLMAQLEREPGLRMVDVSKRLMVSGGNVTAITDQLEREGLVLRQLFQGDRRATSVTLTETGLKRFCEMAADHERWIIELFGGLSRGEKQMMMAILRKLKANLIALAVPAEPPSRSPATGSGATRLSKRPHYRQLITIA